MIILPISHQGLAEEIALQSGVEAVYRAEDNCWTVSSPQIVIDLNRCAQALGGEFSEQDLSQLSKPEGIHRSVTCYRLGDHIYLTSKAGRGNIKLVLPMAMVEAIKANANVRNISMGQLGAEMADYYLMTFGDINGSVAAEIRERNHLRHFTTGERSATSEERPGVDMKNYYPSYPKSMEVKKRQRRLGVQEMA